LTAPGPAGSDGAGGSGRIDNTLSGTGHTDPLLARLPPDGSLHLPRSPRGDHVDHPGAAVKIVRALVAAAAALAIGVTVQVATSSSASATVSHTQCWSCWDWGSTGH
jgi:hypothetical protein